MLDNLYSDYKKVFKEEAYFTNDGIIKEELFHKASEKILWILKEPFGRNEAKKEFDYLGYINKFSLEETKIYDTSSRMWHNITHCNYGIYSGGILWDNMDNCWQNEDVFSSLHKSALINLKKVPGTTKSDYDEIKNYYSQGKEIILKQIDAINPTIIICGGTLKFIYNDLTGIERTSFNSEIQWDTYLWNDRIIIDAYHPSAIISQEKYCNKVINAWKQAKK